ncbi:MAG: hypothetical protein P1U58_16075 [Verrucomicrobiales bacterium]|nr:hypothetical protein [Verrucomicrobiales bacterium]
MNESPLTEPLREALTSVSMGRRYPSDSREQTSLLDILKEIDREAASKLAGDLDRCEELERLGHTPILGVCGMQNSGKSTLVAHHLSAEGRKRVLVGDFSDEGTHRFVFWAPRSWEEDPERKAALERFIGKAFDGVPEMLATDPEKAAEQYNARTARTEEFGVPLLAFDPALDDLGLAILDCPDIQRSLKPEARERTAHLRKEALAKAARLCSCFFIVSEVKQQEDEKLRSVFDAIEAEQTGLPIYYICTMVGMSRPDSVRTDVVDRLKSIRVREKVRRIFASPKLAQVPESGYPENVEYHDLEGELINIADVSRDLDASQLQRQFLDDLKGKVGDDFELGNAAIEKHQKANEETIAAVRERLLRFLDTEFHRGNGGLSPFYTRAVVSELMQSLSRTAPWYLRASMWTARGFQKTKDGLGNGWDWIEKNLIPFRQEKREDSGISRDLGKVTTDSFVLALEGQGWMPQEAEEKTLQEIWNSCVRVVANDEFINESNLRLDLDEKMAAIWEDVSWGRKAVAVASPLVILSGALLTVLVAPIDMGGSAVLFAASASELLLAAGLGGAAGAAASVALDKCIEKHAARPQHSAVFAMLQDRMGVPRATEKELRVIPENKVIKLNESKVPQKDALVHVLKEPVILPDEKALETVEQALGTNLK